MAKSKLIKVVELELGICERSYLNAVDRKYKLLWLNDFIGQTITLNFEQALDLRAMLQNPIGPNETELDQECRSAIWSELHNCLEIK